MIICQCKQAATMAVPMSMSVVEEICDKRSRRRTPSKVFLISANEIKNSLLAVNIEFLETGPAPIGRCLSLLGANFDLNWGFAYVDLNLKPNGVSAFEIPNSEDPALRDTCGYRFCPVENDEIVTMLSELADIRSAFRANRRSRRKLSLSQWRTVDL